MLQLMREEVLESVVRIGGRLGELRLDTELDISHGVVRYLELLKLAALLQRPPGQELSDALADINSRLLAATTPVQREIFQTSTLDETLSGEGSSELGQQIGRRDEHSLGPFLPRKGVGLALSASDIETYRSCPLRYKFARVLRIPTEQTLHQRFGIVVHPGAGALPCRRWPDARADARAARRRMAPGGLRRHAARARAAGDGDHGAHALPRAAARSGLRAGVVRARGSPSGSARITCGGRVDRVDRIVGGSEEQYELIDYKTSRPKSAEQLKDGRQLSLYALAAREAWQLDSSRQAYYYVLDDLKVPVPRGEQDAASVTDLVLEVGEGILAEAFEPTPSHAACSICDYRIVCPVAEK